MVFKSGFNEQYDLGLRCKTAWCRSSTSKAMVLAIKAVLERDPTCAIIYVISGRDVPVQPPAALFTSRQVVTEDRSYCIPPFTTIFCKADESIRRGLMCE